VALGTSTYTTSDVHNSINFEEETLRQTRDNIFIFKLANNSVLFKDLKLNYNCTRYIKFEFVKWFVNLEIVGNFIFYKSFLQDIPILFTGKNLIVVKFVLFYSKRMLEHPIKYKNGFLSIRDSAPLTDFSKMNIFIYYPI